MFTDSQILALTRELNHLLWTPDTPQPGLADGFDRVDLVGGNMHCVDHALVCAALLARKGATVTTRAGRALIAYPELRANYRPHLVAKHWWLTTTEGLCDLSLNLSPISAHKPIIYRNTNLAAPNWAIEFKHDYSQAIKAADKLQNDRLCGVVYQTANKMLLTLSQIEAELDKPSSATQKEGISVSYREFVTHCERVLEGGPSLRGKPQVEAWRRLRTAF